MKESCVHVIYSMTHCDQCNVAIVSAILNMLSFPDHMSTSCIPAWHIIRVFLPPPPKGGGFVFHGIVVFINYSVFFVFEPPPSIHSLILGTQQVIHHVNIYIYVYISIVLIKVSYFSNTCQKSGEIRKCAGTCHIVLLCYKML